MDLDPLAFYVTLRVGYDDPGSWTTDRPQPKLRAWVDAGKLVALTCFERMPGDCHRHCAADALPVEATHL